MRDPREPKTRPISLSIDQFTEICLRRLAKDFDRSLSYIACVAIQNFAENNMSDEERKEVFDTHWKRLADVWAKAEADRVSNG